MHERFLSLSRLLARKSRGIFLHPFAVTAAHTGTKGYGRFTIAVAQTIGRFESLPPPFGASAIHQVELTRVPLEPRGLHAEQPDLAPDVPVGVEQIPRVFD